MASDQSSMFSKNFLILKIFGVWSGKDHSKYYKYYSFFYVFITVACYHSLLTLNLLYTPRKMELLLREVIFYFTELTVAAKISTIFFTREKLFDAFNLIDCYEFVGDYFDKEGTLSKTRKRFRLGSKLYTISSNIAFICLVIVPLILGFIRGTEPELPICKYYFLSDEVRESYFVFWFIYQSFGMYGHMMVNVNMDLLTAGLLLIAIVQLKLLNKNLTNFKLKEEEYNLPIEIQDKIQIARFNKLLRHYEVILNYCATVQDILSAILFFQFGVGSVTLCVGMCGFLQVSSSEMVAHVFLVIYLSTMALQIYVPGLLGAQLSHESQNLVTAAYNSEWIPRSESFKRSLKLFRERAQTPIVITGLKIFPLSLITFTSIMKTAYSFFTLIRNVQDK